MNKKEKKSEPDPQAPSQLTHIISKMKNKDELTLKDLKAYASSGQDAKIVSVSGLESLKTNKTSLSIKDTDSQQEGSSEVVSISETKDT